MAMRNWDKIHHWRAGEVLQLPNGGRCYSRFLRIASKLVILQYLLTISESDGIGES
jgi:hypothetical protein